MTFVFSLRQFVLRSFLLQLLLFCTSCRSVRVSVPAAASSDNLLPYESENLCWERVSDGIDFSVHTDSHGRLMYELVRIDLRNPGLSIFSMKSTAEWQPMTTVSAFAKRTGADAAINTSPFFMRNRFVPWSKGRPCGLVVSGGKLLVPADGRYCAIAFYRAEDGGWTARIFDRQTDVLSDGQMPDEAAGGFWTIVRGGTIIPFSDRKDDRSAAALSENGRILYLLAGKQLTYGECAAVFRSLGADSAMQFDGGSSAQLVVRGKAAAFRGMRRRVCAVIGFSAGGGAD